MENDAVGARGHPCASGAVPQIERFVVIERRRRRPLAGPMTCDASVPVLGPDAHLFAVMEEAGRYCWTIVSLRHGEPELRCWKYAVTDGRAM